MPHGNSKQNQSVAETAYRFGDFELYPRDRQLQRAGVTVPLQPKAFDALLCLIRRSGHLVSKQELRQTLWPSVHVTEANLTNTIVSLRKVIGRNAILTVSKHGYRFDLPVAGEPGIARATYERFVRAKELSAQRSLESMHLARDFFWLCLAEDPTFASAWAWLGRCCWFLAKFSGAASASADLAHAAFQRAFTLDPDLAEAHRFYTLVQVDTGNASAAITRLLNRLQRHPDEPESFASLVQALRFRGLLDESVRAHYRAAELDPTITTSVAHTHFFVGQYAAAIESYGGRAAYYLDAAAWAALGEHDRAITLLRDRVAKLPLSTLMTALLSSLLAVLEGRSTEALHLMEIADTTREPEILAYFARHYGKLGHTDQAFAAINRAQQSGFICAPQTLRDDPWLAPLRQHAAYAQLLNESETLVAQARSEGVPLS